MLYTILFTRISNRYFSTLTASSKVPVCKDTIYLFCFLCVGYSLDLLTFDSWSLASHDENHNIRVNIQCSHTAPAVWIPWRILHEKLRRLCRDAHPTGRNGAPSATSSNRQTASPDKSTANIIA